MAETSHGGRPSSWLVVAVIFIGFAVGGISLIIGPLWWMFWTGAGIAGIGFLLGVIVRITDDVIIDAPRILPEEQHPAVEHARSERPGIATDVHSIHPHG